MASLFLVLNVGAGATSIGLSAEASSVAFGLEPSRAFGLEGLSPKDTEVQPD